MKYVPMYRSMLGQPPWVQADDDAVGVGTRLLSYVSSDGLEDPLIKNCRNWPDRTWMATCQTCRAGVEKAVAAQLAEWRDDDLFVNGFDYAGKEKVDRLRHNGGGRPPKKPGGSTAENHVVSGSGTKSEPNGNPSPSLSLPYPASPDPSVPTAVAVPLPRGRS